MKLADPRLRDAEQGADLEVNDYVEAGKLNKELLELRRALSEAEERWLQLADL